MPQPENRKWHISGDLLPGAEKSRVASWDFMWKFGTSNKAEKITFPPVNKEEKRPLPPNDRNLRDWHGDCSFLGEVNCTVRFLPPGLNWFANKEKGQQHVFSALERLGRGRNQIFTRI
jgi:hypothetical protein